MKHASQNPSGRLAQGVLALILAVGLAACQSHSGSAAASGEDQPGSAEENRVIGEYLVEVEDRDGARAAIEAAFEAWRVESIGALETNRPLYVVEIANDPGPGAVREGTAGAAGIVQVQPNYKYSASGGAGEPGEKKPGMSEPSDGEMSGE